MARSKIEDRFTRKLTKTGGGRSMTVTMPIEFIRELRWQEHQKVTVRKSGARIIIEDWKQ